MAQHNPIIREWIPLEGGGFHIRNVTDEGIIQAVTRTVTHAEESMQDQVSISQLHDAVDTLAGWCPVPDQAYFDAEKRLHTALDELATLRAAVLATGEHTTQGEA